MIKEERPREHYRGANAAQFERYSRLDKFVIKPPRPNWKAWTDEEINMLSKLAGKKTAAQIGAVLNRSVHSVKGMARILKIRLRLKGGACPWAKYSDELAERARQMHDDGIKPKAISQALSIPYWAVHSIVYFKRIG